jgi:uroporphyrin-3 C-methyltransferase
MSDTPETPTDATESRAAESHDRRHTERREGERRRVERAARQGALGLLFGILGFVVAAVLAWRQIGLERELARDRGSDELASRDLELVRAQLRDLEKRAADNAEALGRLAPLPGAVDSARAELEGIQSRLAAPQRAVARVEAAHLVEFAIHRLQLERDVAGATQLFEAAEQRLAAANDPALAPARAQILRDLGALKGATRTDVRAIAGRLARVEDLADTLPMLGAIHGQYVAPDQARTPEPGFARAWQQLTTSLRDLVAVRRVSDAAIELVSLEEIGVRRHHLETLLFSARLAALRGDADEYGTTLRTASEWLERYFDVRDARVREAATELADLERLQVAAPVPDVSASLRMLRGGTS